METRSLEADTAVEEVEEGAGPHGIGGWLLRPFLARIGEERADGLRQRVADEISTTFASSYGVRLSLADVVDPDHVRRYGRMATGDKALVTPHGS